MKWSEQYAIGIPRIDDQHRMLFRIIDDYSQALTEDKGERTYEIFLQTLRGYSRAHFEFEETCMARHLCPAARTNQEAHAQFLVTISDYEAHYEGQGYVPADATALVAFLERWVDEHICTIDIQLREFVPGSSGSS